MRLLLLVAVIAFTQTIACAQTYTVGTTYYGYNNLVEFVYGNLPIIITAPHGGTLTGGLPDRTCPNITTTTDTNADDLAIALKNKLAEIFGKTPHLIVCNVKRLKLDVNRPVDEGTCGDPTATISWNDYHNFIQVASNRVAQQYGKGLLIDIHGHGHTIQRVELGYNLSSTQLGYSDSYLNGSTAINASTIKYLSSHNLDNVNHASLIRGIYSFGAYLSNSGYPAVPSPNIQNPGSDPYFSGGYTVETYGSKDGGTIDAIQIESNYTGLRDNTTNINNYASALAYSIKSYLEKHYFTSGALPLQWRSFSAELVDKSVLLDWSTYDENNTLDFIIQHSANGINWDSIGRVDALGSSSSDNRYSFLHQSPYSGQNYYRLLQRDKDGKFSLSKIVAISYASSFDDSRVFPNPVEKNSILHFSNGISGKIQIYNSIGQVVSNIQLQTISNQIQVPNLIPGLYWIKTGTDVFKININ